MKLFRKATSGPSLSLKTIASFIVLSFVATQILIPTPTSFAMPAGRQAPNSNVTGGDPVPVATAQVLNGKIAVPPELGKIEESFQGTSGKTILFIQDAHDSLEAQENIAKLIGKFVKENGIKTVFEEGYEGPLPTDKFFGFIKDPKIKQKVSYFLLDKLRLGGAEYAHVNRTQDFDLIGVEDLKLYGENIKYYQESFRSRKDIEADLGELFSRIATLANQYFPKELKTWLKRKELFSEGKLPLLNYLKELRRLSLRGAPQGDAAISFSKSYPALSILLAAETTKDKKLIKQLNALDSKIVFEEMARVERDLSNAFLRSGQDKQIFDYYQSLSLLKRLNQIQLTQSEYEAAKDALQKLETQKLVDFIVFLTRRSLVLSKEWERHIKDAVRFYDVAHNRDGAIDQHIRAFQEGKEESAILVFGGFHASAIKDMLRQQGFSYVVISPRITAIDKRHQDYYKRLMSDGRHSFEAPFLAARANRAPGYPYLAATGKEEFVRTELRAIASSVEAGNSDPQLIERRLATFSPVQEAQPIDLATKTSKYRSETRGEDVVSKNALVGSYEEAVQSRFEEVDRIGLVSPKKLEEELAQASEGRKLERPLLSFDKATYSSVAGVILNPHFTGEKKEISYEVKDYWFPSQSEWKDVTVLMAEVNGSLTQFTEYFARFGETVEDAWLEYILYKAHGVSLFTVVRERQGGARVLNMPTDDDAEASVMASALFVVPVSHIGGSLEQNDNDGFFDAQTSEGYASSGEMRTGSIKLTQGHFVLVPRKFERAARAAFNKNDSPKVIAVDAIKRDHEYPDYEAAIKKIIKDAPGVQFFAHIMRLPTEAEYASGDSASESQIKIIRLPITISDQRSENRAGGNSAIPDFVDPNHTRDRITALLHEAEKKYKIRTREEWLKILRRGDDEGFAEFISQQKAMLSMDTYIGCPLDCAYCFRAEKGQLVPQRIKEDLQIVAELLNHPFFIPHKTPIGLQISKTDPFLNQVKESTFKLLELLDSLGLTNVVSVVTKMRLKEEDVRRLAKFKHIKLTVGCTASNMPQKIEPASNLEGTKKNILLLKKYGIKTILFFRPIIIGQNDSEDSIKAVLSMAKESGVDSIAVGGIRLTDKERAHLVSHGVEIPAYETKDLLKYLPEDLEAKLLRIHKQLGLTIPMVRRTSCARSVLWGIPDYNAHWADPHKNCFATCPLSQKAICEKWRRQRPSERDVFDLLKRIERQDVGFRITEGEVLLDGQLSIFELSFLRHNLAYPVSNQKNTEAPVSANSLHDELVKLLARPGLLQVYEKDTPELIDRKLKALLCPKSIDRASDEARKKVFMDGYLPGPFMISKLRGTSEWQDNINYQRKNITKDVQAYVKFGVIKPEEADRYIQKALALLEAYLGYVRADGSNWYENTTFPENRRIVQALAEIAVFGDLNEKRESELYHDQNKKGNEIAVQAVAEIISDLLDRGRYEDAVKASIYAAAGNITFTDPEFQSKPTEERNAFVRNKIQESYGKRLGLSGLPEFTKEVLSAKEKKKIVYITDDNGDVIYHMLLTQHLLKKNERLEVVLVPRRSHGKIDASYRDVVEILENPAFSFLRQENNKHLMGIKSRFYVSPDGPDYMSMNGDDISAGFVQLLDESDVVMCVGAASFTAMNGVKKPVYHFVYNDPPMMIAATGLEKGTILFTRAAASRPLFARYGEGKSMFDTKKGKQAVCGLTFKGSWIRNRAQSYAVSFNDKKSRDVSLSGGKGASLHELATIEGINVPEGFNIITSAYDEFIRENDLMADIKLLDKMSGEWLEKSLSDEKNLQHHLKTLADEINKQAEVLRNKLMAGRMPEEVGEAIKLMYETLCDELGVENLSVAVRSSATVEDMLEALFAGQHDTFLNVKTKERVLSHAKACWASLFTARAVGYRNDEMLKAYKKTMPGSKPRDLALPGVSKFMHSKVKMAVVIQRMINPHGAGIAFTADPVTGKSQIIIEANYGLGESVVSQSATPDKWVIDETGQKIISARKGGKTNKIVSSENGTEVQETSLAERGEYVFDEPKVLSLARSLINIGTHYKGSHGWQNVDTEFAVDEFGIYFVQARPAEIALPKNRGIPIEIAQKANLIYQGGDCAMLGVIAGRIRVVAGLEDAEKRLQKGDILVTRQTEPEWTSVMSDAGGIMTDIGGMLGHAAIYGRSNRLPTIVDAGNATELLKKYDGKMVTLDSINRVVYEGELALEDGPINSFVRKDLKGGEATKTGYVTHDEDQEGKWIGKPEYPLSGWQLELYSEAWRHVEKLLNVTIPLRLKEGNKIQIKEPDIKKYEIALQKLSIDQLEGLLTQRQKIVQEFAELSENFELTGENIKRLFEIYPQMIAHFHIRWAYQAMVIEPMQKKALDPIPAVLRPDVMLYFNPPAETETSRKEEAVERILEECKSKLSLFQGNSLAEIARALQKEAPGLYAAIFEIATNYKYDSDDIRNPVPVNKVIEEILRKLKSGPQTITAKRQGALPDVGRYVDDYAHFERVMKLANRQSVQKENEHHMQVRGQWKIRKKLLQFAEDQVRIGKLQNAMEIFNESKKALLEQATARSLQGKEKYFELIILDLDDTLLPSAEIGLTERKEASFIHLYAEHRKLPYEEAREVFLEKMKEYGLTSYKRTALRLGISLEEMEDSAGQIDVSQFVKQENARLRQELQRLKDSGYKIVVVTNSPRQLASNVLQSLGIMSLIEGVYTPSDAGVKKPDPGIFEFAIKANNSTADRAISVGNSMRKDIEPAIRLGMKTIHISSQNEIYDLHASVLGVERAQKQLRSESRAISREDIFKAFGVPMPQIVKVAVLDADFTLWGETVSEVGAAGVKITDAFLAVQKKALELKEQGVLLVISSRNAPEDIEAVFASRPEMALKRQDVVGIWADNRNKAEHLKEIAEKLHLGLDSFVFLDDSPFERARVREAFTEVLVPELPASPLEWPKIMDGFIPNRGGSVTQESQNRTRLYQDQERREQGWKAAKSVRQSFNDYLRGLGMTVEVFEETADSSRIDRVVELFGRAHRFNMTGRVYTRQEMMSLLSGKHGAYRVFSAQQKDREGDQGIVAVMVVNCNGAKPIIESFCQSCRAWVGGMGGKVENLFMAYVVGKLGKVIGNYVPIGKNQGVKEVYAKMGEGIALVDVPGKSAKGFLFDRNTSKIQVPDWFAMPENVKNAVLLAGTIVAIPDANGRSEMRDAGQQGYRFWKEKRINAWVRRPWAMIRRAMSNPQQGEIRNGSQQSLGAQPDASSSGKIEPNVTKTAHDQAPRLLAYEIKASDFGIEYTLADATLDPREDSTMEPNTSIESSDADEQINQMNQSAITSINALLPFLNQGTPEQRDEKLKRLISWRYGMPKFDYLLLAELPRIVGILKDAEAFFAALAIEKAFLGHYVQTISFNFRIYCRDFGTYLGSYSMTAQAVSQSLYSIYAPLFGNRKDDLKRFIMELAKDIGAGRVQNPATKEDLAALFAERIQRSELRDSFPAAKSLKAFTGALPRPVASGDELKKASMVTEQPRHSAYRSDLARETKHSRAHMALPISGRTMQVSIDRADRMLRSIRTSTQPAMVFVDAEDLLNFSEAQKLEYLFVALSNKSLCLVVYNDRGHQVQDQDDVLNALFKLNNVKKTGKDFAEAQISYDRSNAPSIHLSKQILPSQELVQRLKGRVSFFKTQGENGGTLAAALLWAWSGGEDVRMRDISQGRDGFWTVAETLVNAIQRSYDTTLAFAIAA